MRSCLCRTAFLAVLVSGVLSGLSRAALAKADWGGNCGNSGCHGETSGRESTTPTSVTAQPGDTVTFTTNVTGPGGTSYAVFTGKATAGQSATQSLHAITGTTNPANVLDIAGPANSGWTARSSGNYYTSSGGGAASYSKQFSFVVPANTPADTYLLRMGVGGKSGGEWTEFTSLSLTVGAVPEPATWAMLAGGVLWGFVCWRGRMRLTASRPRQEIRGPEIAIHHHGPHDAA